MTISEYTKSFDDLANFFGKKGEADVLKEWFKEFGWLAPVPFERICQAAREECERFPSGKFIYAKMRELGVSRQRLGGGSAPKIIMVHCECGDGYGLLRESLRPGTSGPYWKDRMDGQLIFGAKRGCLTCGRVHASEEILGAESNGEVDFFLPELLRQRAKMENF